MLTAESITTHVIRVWTLMKVHNVDTFSLIGLQSVYL